MKKIVEALGITQAICESRENAKVVRYMSDEDLSRRFCEAYKEGDVWGVYYNDDEELICELRDGSIFELLPDDVLTYDIIFNDDTDSNNVGGNYTLQEARNYIEMNNGTEWGYFKDYKGGTVSIHCNETDEEVYSETVR